MKNLFKVFGIIALVAIIGFSFVACDNGTTDNSSNNNGGENNNGGNEQTQAPDVTFTLSDGTAGDNKYNITVSGAEWTDFGYTDRRINSGVVSHFGEVYTLSADKKTVEVAVYDNPDSSPWNIDEDTTVTVTFADEAASTNAMAPGLINDTSVDSSLKSDFWVVSDGRITYQGKITLVGEGVSITVKDNVFKPE